MKIKILYEENITQEHGQHHPHFTSIDVPDNCDVTAIIEDANRMKFAITKAKVNCPKNQKPETFVPKTKEEMFVPCETLQDAVDVWNDYEFNHNRQFYRKIDDNPRMKNLNGKVGKVGATNADDDSGSDFDAPDYRSADESEQDLTRADTVRLLRKMFPEETVKAMVAVYIDGVSMREYARQFCDNPNDPDELAKAENSISHRLNRAKEKFKKTFPTLSDYYLSQGYTV